MSIARPTADNPTAKYIEFKSSQGAFRFYDKAQSENVTLPTPFEFVLIDEYATVSGYNESSNSGIYANEVQDTRVEPLTVKCKGGEIASGIYAQIKDNIKAAGGKYTKALYALYDGELVNIKLSGASFAGFEDKSGKVSGGWVSFKQNDKFKVCFKETVEGKKGTNTYLVPVFEHGSPVTPEEYKLAVEKLNLLKEYKRAVKNNATEEDFSDEREYAEAEELTPETAQSDLSRAALEAFGDSNLEPKKEKSIKGDVTIDKAAQLEQLQNIL